ncbi:MULTISPECIES: septal ring lytic transglycosylase RlpA family protein [Myroides]|uniref:Probable endolytic peptidoglycan transglycosylase RlpA n=1 Tax=Myroides albus TaxID=2562892 RepID=A0A6I3LIA5_9FLAO|nr:MULTISPECIES: septal ring lytic transglycosylase RlpA family protein [Myroides]MTG97567.1 septal ring lytic transglycosylase RlpA family protein [Myroides albus]MVX36104.1 septal ring lytic transglycosylase RlpA family protein [Myroides sp. LoEW2-1]UVD81158.1 septal ring lytic transglycosylase RlpA family protein [Myroides albus]
MKKSVYLLVLFTFILFSFTSGDYIFKPHTTRVISAYPVSDTLAVDDDSIVVAIEDEDDYELINEETKASYYHDKFTGRKTASGAVFNNQEYTAAHKTLPFGTKVKVTNINNQRSVILTITDRGPFVKGRSIDLSKKAFLDLADNLNSGVLDVKIERLIEAED